MSKLIIVILGILTLSIMIHSQSYTPVILPEKPVQSFKNNLFAVEVTEVILTVLPYLQILFGLLIAIGIFALILQKIWVLKKSYDIEKSLKNYKEAMPEKKKNKKQTSLIERINNIGKPNNEQY